MKNIRVFSKLVLKTGLMSFLFCYWIFITHIPVMSFIANPDCVVGVWLISVGLSLCLAVWLFYAFSYVRLVVWLVLSIVLHMPLWLSGNVVETFDVDHCLDTGGAWHGGRCVAE